jgi:site-specific recombinase XerD
MGRKSTHNLPPGIQFDQYGVYWATLEGEHAKIWRERFAGRSLPRRKATDLKAARKLQRQLIADLDKGNDPNAENPKVSEWVGTCIDRKRKLAASTARRYRQSLKWQIEPSTLGRMRIRQVQKKQVEAWIEVLIAQKPQNNDSESLNPHSIRNAFAPLRMAFNIAVTDGLIPKNPCKGVELPQPDDEEIRPLSPEEVNVLFELLNTSEQGKRHRNTALYHVAIRCGLRQGELLGLRWKDIDLEKRELRVAGQLKDKAHSTRGKTPNARRAVPLSADTVEALHWHKQNQEEERAIKSESWNAAKLVFVSENGTPLGPSNVDRQFDALLKRAQLPDICFHGLRHTYVALSIAAGVDLYTVSRRMGHNSITVTADKYGHLYQGSTQDADLIDRLLQGGAK